MGGAAIPYLRFVEVNLQIPWIRNYNEDVLLLVIPTMTYSKTVPVMVGTKIIDKALSLIIVGELENFTSTWRQTHLGAVMLGSLQLSCSSSDKSKVIKGLQAPLNRVTLWRCRRSESMMSKIWFVLHRKSLFPHLAPSMCGPTPVSRDTACEYMSSWNWCLVPSCSSSGTHSYLWGTTPWFLKGTSLSVQFEHLCHGSTH